MKTFILEWRPSISSYKMEDFEQDFHFLEYGEFNWSVWDWENARNGDNFYMVKCGEGRTGIVMKGFFTSDPYEADDWSGKNRQVHYMDYRPTFMIHPNHPKGMLTTQKLEKTIPEFEWNGGHSGRELPDELVGKLDALWEEYIGQFKAEEADGETLEFNFIPEATVDDAIKQASYALYDKKDLFGNQMILHSLKVGLNGSNDDEKICGFLGKVLESGEDEFSAGSLREEGFSERTVDTLLLLSNPSEDDEEEHIRNIVASGNKTAIAVKRNDIIISIEEANAARNNELLTSLVGNLEFLTGIID